MGKLLRGQRLGIVLTITLLRARETCRLKGYGDNAVVDPHLRERDYGEYEGRTTAEIQEQRPGRPYGATECRAERAYSRLPSGPTQ
jgi:broad specificity phosphatase PhoE